MYPTTSLYLKSLGVMLILSIGASATAQDAPKMFSAVDIATTDLKPNQEKIFQKLKAEKTALDVQLVRLSDSAFDADTVSFNLGADRVVAFERTDKTMCKGKAFTWSATVDSGAPLAHFYVAGNRKTGSFRDGKFVYNVRPLGDGLHVLIKRDASKIPPDHPKAFKKVEEEGTNAKAPKQKNDPQGDTPPNTSTTIGVMVLYTTAVSSNHVSVSDFIDSLVAITNSTYSQSGIPCELSLVHAGEVAYTESGSVAIDLNRLKATADGHIDIIHTLRDAHKADLVLMLIDRGDAAGYAAAILANAETAFAVADDEYSDWYFTFAHEVGHLLGARHNPEADGSSQPFAYGHGYRNMEAGWRTVMSYNCPLGCTRIGYWSNPSTSHNGSPTGTASNHDNARVLRETVRTIAAFK